MLSAKALGMLVKWAEKLDAFLKLCKNERNVDMRNMLSDSRTKIIDQNKTRLIQATKFV